MARLQFTQQLRRFVEAPTLNIEAQNVRTLLHHAFEIHPQLRGYVLDDQGGLRQHVVIFVDGNRVLDRAGLSDPVGPNSDIYVMQALSGG